MSFSMLFYRGVRLLCKPFVKLNGKMERILEKKAKGNSRVESFAQRLDNAPNRDAFFERINVITHAGGGLQGLDYLNCEEAFPHYYQKGNRTFEYDVDEKDGSFILAHTDGEGLDCLDGRFTPLKIEKCLDMIKLYSDIIVIFDCKFTDLTAFAKFIKEYVKEENALNRIVIQVFNEENILQVQSVYDYKMLHVCMMATDYLKTLQTCIKYKIGAVSISVKALQERNGWEIFDKNNICAFAYTVNTVKEYKHWKEKGIFGAFSDFLYETDVQAE